MIDSNNHSPHLPFPQSSTSHEPSSEALAMAEVMTNLMSYLPKELRAHEPVDLRNRSIKSSEDQVVAYTEDRLLMKKKLCDGGKQSY